MKQQNMERGTNSWMDDLPKCNTTSTGFLTNQIYRGDGSRQEAHTYGDRFFHCVDEKENIYLYAIFSGQKGCSVAETAMQRIAADILLGQLKVTQSDEDVKDVLRQAFLLAEEAYKDSIGEHLARKTSLQCELPDGISEYEISLNHNDILEQLNSINNYLSIGASAVLALIYNSKLYICNIGNCRALLCKNDSNNVLRVVQLSVDHNLHNEDEVLRLHQLRLDVAALKQSPLQSTRCIGNYISKMGYKDCSYLSGAISEPVLSQPEIVGAIPLDDSCRFILLMSDGLCKALHDVYSSEGNLANKKIVEMVVEQFRTQATLTGVSQSAVNKVVQLHHDTYMKNIEENTVSFTGRDDITLLIKNFNFPITNTILKAVKQQVQFNSVVQEQRINVQFYSDSDVSNIVTNAEQDTNNSTNTERSELNDEPPEPPYNQNIRIRPYVDFTVYYNNIAAAREKGILPSNSDFD